MYMYYITHKYNRNITFIICNYNMNINILYTINILLYHIMLFINSAFYLKINYGEEETMTAEVYAILMQ